MKLLDQKAIIVTGASSGIGLAAARLFAREGARVVLVARNAVVVEDVARGIVAEGGQAVACPGDVSEEVTHARAVTLAQERFGHLDAAFNNAGTVGDIAPFADQSIANWNAVLATNLTAAFLAARAQIPAMMESGGGSLVFTSSFVGNSVGLPGMGVYGTAKAGLSGLVKAIAADYSHRGIRANALVPGGVDTPMGGSEENKAWAATLHPMRRIAQPEEIARAALFLLSDASSFVTGGQLWADGGNAATKIQAAD